uniref:Uncharacterized protein n=1 Tax=candidate division CPR3 bacterium TaxID=2268181 RepID=A0A7C4RAD8_UNCC3
MMRILGIDPGTATTGWGVITFEGGKFKTEGCGCILTPAKQNQAVCLAHIFNEFNKIITMSLGFTLSPPLSR